MQLPTIRLSVYGKVRSSHNVLLRGALEQVRFVSDRARNATRPLIVGGMKRGRTAYYSAEQRVVIAVSALVVGASFIGLTTYAIASGGLDLFSLALIAAYGTPTWWSLRAAISGAYSSPQGVRIRNPVRTIDIPWGDIDHFRVATTGAFAPVGEAVRKDGSIVRIFGIQASGRSDRARSKQAAEPIEALNAELTRRRELGSP